LLKPFGFELREAANGQEALQVQESWAPQLVLMDIRMPVMDGLEATRRIKATKAGVRTKIVAQTAHALEEERIRILAAGCDDFIRKPYRDSEIFESLAKHLGIRFVYASEMIAAPEAAVPDRAELALLPDPLISELEKVLLRLDTGAIGAVIDRIRRHNKDLGESLATLVAEFQYGAILRLIDEHYAKNKSEERM
jgi:CheY-like chemotaxis protein